MSETLVKKQKAEANCYGNRTCLSIPKKDLKNKEKTNDKDNLKEDFINFKNYMIGKLETMKSSFFAEVKQVKNQLLNKGNNISTSSMLEMVIVQLQEPISILTEQLDRKHKVIDRLLAKFGRGDNIEPPFHYSST